MAYNRRSARTDDNQTDIVDALRAIGCSVRITSNVGDGFPDLIIGDRGINYLMEVKDGNKAKSRQNLTDDQKDFHDEWRGQVVVVNSVVSALKFITERRIANARKAGVPDPGRESV